jgi:hypothetical protein
MAVAAIPVTRAAVSLTYRDLLTGTTVTSLSASVQSLNTPTGAVTINGVDSKHPTTPFRFTWGDGQTSQSFFPASHNYGDAAHNYVVTVTATYSDGSTGSQSVLVRFVATTLGAYLVPSDLTCSVPATMPNLTSTQPGNSVPALQPLGSAAFQTYSREVFERVLSVYDVVQQDLVNGNTYRADGTFRQVMLAPPTGSTLYGVSYWFTSPPVLAMAETALGSAPDWSSFAHELGHNATLNSPAAFRLGGHIDGNANAIVSETLAQIFQHVTCWLVVNNAAAYGLPDDLALDIAQRARGSFATLKNNNASGAFASWNNPATPADETLPTFMTLAYQFFANADLDGNNYHDAVQRMMTRLQLWNADWQQRYSPTQNMPAAETFRSTMMVAAISYGVQKDLRATFSQLGFPVDDLIYTAIYNGQGDFTHVITSPTVATAMAGSAFSYRITASGSPTSYATAGLPDGLSCNSVTGEIAGIPNQSGNYTVRVSASSVAGTGTINITLVISAPGASSIITTPPASQHVMPGSNVTFSVVASGSGPLTYQWKLNGVAIVGATNTTCTVANAQAGNMGFYSVTVSNSAGSVDSAVAILTVSGGSSRLTGLSTRGYVPTGGALTPGFYLRGSGAKAIIVRGVGPTLGGFGIAGPLSDPRMDLIPVGGTTLLTNDDWGTNTNLPALRAAMPFPLVEGSRDAAALATLATATNYGYTVRIVPNGTATDGIAMAEVYDLDATTAPVQLISLSTLGYTGPGEKILTPGFIITGDGPKQLLVRAVGPTLGAAPYNVPGVLADPQFRVVPLNKDFTVASNDNWGGTAVLQAAFAQTYAFPLPADSKDAAVIVRLPPGGYTVQATGVGDTTGTVLVEVYDMDP